MENYSRVLDNPQHINRPKNAIQRVSGYDITNNMQGHIKYSKLGTRYVVFVYKEIEARGGTYDKKVKVRKLGKILLALEVDIQKEQINIATANECPTDDMINKETYFPKCHLLLK